VQELAVLHDVLVALQSVREDRLDHATAVIAAVDASHEVQRAREQAVLGPLRAVLKGLPSVPDLEVDANGGAKCPATCVTVEVSQPAGLTAMPLVDAHRMVIGHARASAQALQKFVHNTHLLNDKSNKSPLHIYH
jgi:hypothetical protein